MTFDPKKKPLLGVKTFIKQRNLTYFYTMNKILTALLLSGVCTATLAQEITDCNAAFFDAAHQFAGCIPGVHEVLRRQGLMKNIYCLNLIKIMLQCICCKYTSYTWVKACSQKTCDSSLLKAIHISPLP